MTRKCVACGGSVVSDSSSSQSVCSSCGTVVEESGLVSQLEFQDAAGGGSAVVGSFVSDYGPMMGSMSMGGGRGAGGGYGYGGSSYGPISVDSRELTLRRGRRDLQRLAGVLSLPARHIESGMRYFTLAVHHNFLQGRRAEYVVAVCLYIVVRREKGPLLLIDFADVLQTSVYALGSTFLKFKQVLNIALPVLDPSLFIHRFAAKLEFGSKKHLVAMSALRLVQSMKRDWIHHGRRPAGICGAALLVAARLHGFRRTHKEITQVVRVCELTLRKRLGDFEATPAAGLTVADFQTTVLDEESDPPAFTVSKIKSVESLKRVAEILDEYNMGPKDDGVSLKDFINSLDSSSDRSLMETHVRAGNAAEAAAQHASVPAPAAPTSALDPDDPFADLDDEELDAFILSPGEAKFKSAVWASLNHDYVPKSAATTAAATTAAAEGTTATTTTTTTTASPPPSGKRARPPEPPNPRPSKRSKPGSRAAAVPLPPTQAVDLAVQCIRSRSHDPSAIDHAALRSTALFE